MAFDYLTSWITRGLGTVSDLTGAVFGDETWVVVGDDGSIYSAAATSNAPLNWVKRTAANGFSSSFWDVAWNGSDLFAAVGANGEIQTSPDGTTWTHRTGAVAQSMFAIAYGDGIWVAVGTSGKIQTSSNGTSWTERTAANSYTGSFRGVAYDGSLDLWVIVGDSGEIQTSSDGITWTHRTPANSFTGTILGVASDGSGLFVFVGQSAEIQTSTDGTNWTHRTAAAGFTDHIGAVVHDSTGVWVISGGSEIQTSPDAITWSIRGFPNIGVGILASNGGGIFLGAATNDGYVVTNQVLSTVYVSAEQTYTTAGSLTLAHYLAAKPDLVQVVMKCTTAEGGYSVGDELIWTDGATGSSRGMSITFDATNLYVKFGSSAIEICRKDTGTGIVTTPSRWKMIFKAFRL